MRKKADAEEEKEEIYLMRCPCKSGVETDHKWWFVAMAIVGNKNGINKKTSSISQANHHPKWLFFHGNCGEVFTK